MKARSLALAASGFFLASSVAAAAMDLSTSVLRPTPIDPATGVVSGNLPGGDGLKSYYIAVELAAGDLITQLEVAGPSNKAKRVEFELLDAGARVSESGYVMAEADAKNTMTQTYPIDSGGKRIVRLNVEGKETGRFCVLLGGTALPTAAGSSCPGAVVVAVAPPPPSAPPAPPPPPSLPTQKTAAVEVIVTKCEERLRVGSDLLFDFDRADVRQAARPALEQIARRVAEMQKPALVEGHTDSKGSDSYNQRLSEKRAHAIQTELGVYGAPVAFMRVEGRGESQPIAPNERPDGTDDPEARQQNRRVEVAIRTCQ
jgi:outer membrane protein OmpA-like peptidoglycan-associated protein